MITSYLCITMYIPTNVKRVSQGKTGQRRYRLDIRLCEKFLELAGGDDNFVFADSAGKLSSSQALSLRVRRLAKKAGITGEKLGAHTLRHSAGSLVAKFTRSDLAVKALLQHDVVTSSMVYVHDVEDSIKQEISPLELMTRGYEELHGKQLRIAETAESLVVESAVTPIEVADDMLEEMMREVPEGVEVRPLFHSVDLALVRKALIMLSRSDGLKYKGDALGLWSRMIRKVK